MDDGRLAGLGLSLPIMEPFAITTSMPTDLSLNNDMAGYIGPFIWCSTCQGPFQKRIAWSRPQDLVSRPIPSPNLGSEMRRRYRTPVLRHDFGCNNCSTFPVIHVEGRHVVHEQFEFLS